LGSLAGFDLGSLGGLGSGIAGLGGLMTGSSGDASEKKDIALKGKDAGGLWGGDSKAGGSSIW